MRFYFGKERCHLQSAVIKVKVIKVIKDFGLSKKSLIIPLSYKIRLNQVCAANKIHPYNHFSEYFFVFLQIYCADMELSMAYPPKLQAHHYQMIRA